MSRHLEGLTNKQLSVRQETRGAQDFGGVVNSGSGNKDRKNDVRVGRDLSIEFKVTRAKSYRLQLSELLLASRNAIIECRDAIFGLEFVVGSGSHRFVIVPEHMWLEQQRTLDIHSGCRAC